MDLSADWVSCREGDSPEIKERRILEKRKKLLTYCMAQQYDSGEQVQLQERWIKVSVEVDIWYNNACIYTLRAGCHSGWKHRSKIITIRRAWFWSNVPSGRLAAN